MRRELQALQPLRRGEFPEGVPLVVGLMVETLPGRVAAVAERLSELHGIEVIGGDGDRRVAVVWTSPGSDQLFRQAEQLLRDDAEILGLFPTFIGQDDVTGGGSGA